MLEAFCHTSYPIYPSEQAGGWHQCLCVPLAIPLAKGKKLPLDPHIRVVLCSDGRVHREYHMLDGVL